MSLLIIPLLCLLAASKIILQSNFSKSGDSDIQSMVFYNGIMFLTAALLLVPSFFDGGISCNTLIFGTIMGVLSFAFQLFYTSAFTSGKMSLTVIINNFSMLLPMLVSFVMFDESYGILNLIGTFLALISFVLTVSSKTNKSDPQKNRKIKWLFFVLMTFLCNGMIAVNQKIYSVNSIETQIFEFVATAYIVSTILSLVTLIFFKLQGHKKVFKYSVKYIITFFVSGCILSLFQCINTYAASVIEGTVLYSTYNCGVSVLSVLAGRIIFKESLTIKQYMGLIVGIVAIVLLCL